MPERLGMSSACKYKEGAWAFLRTRLLPQYEPGETVRNTGGFPINRADFELLAQQQMTPEYITDYSGAYELDSSGNKIEMEVNAAGESYEPLDGLHYYSVSQEDYEQIMALYNAISPAGGLSEDVLSMIVEQAGAFFAGDKSLEDVSGLIQNRAMLYVNEQ